MQSKKTREREIQIEGRKQERNKEKETGIDVHVNFGGGSLGTYYPIIEKHPCIHHHLLPRNILVCSTPNTFDKLTTPVQK